MRFKCRTRKPSDLFFYVGKLIRNRLGGKPGRSMIIEHLSWARTASDDYVDVTVSTTDSKPGVDRWHCDAREFPIYEAVTFPPKVLSLVES